MSRKVLCSMVFGVVSAACFAQAANDTPAGATVQVGPGFIADNNGGGASVADGPFTINCNFGPAVVGVWVDGGGFPAAELGCNDDSGCAGGVGNGYESAVVVACTSGIGVYVSVSGWGGTGNGGAYVVDFTELVPVGNDTPAGATVQVGPGFIADNNTTTARCRIAPLRPPTSGTSTFRRPPG
jgi:hypothetical protein